MKIAASKADAFIAKPDPGVAALLLFGPDAGLVRERAQAFARHCVADIADPFHVTELTAAQILDDPGRLGAEMMAQSLMGGRRIVMVRWSQGLPRLDQRLAEIISALPLFAENRKAHKDETALVLEAGDLTGRSALRSLFEAASGGAAIGCYADDERSLERIIQSTLSKAGFSLAPDANAYLVERLGGDRGMTRQELEKLVLYKQNAPDRQITIEDCRVLIGDSSALALDEMVDAAYAGKADEAGRHYDRAMTEGDSPIAVIRLMQRHGQRLHLMLAKRSQGMGEDALIQSERVHFRREPALRQQLRLWAIARLERVLSDLTQAELDCKTTGMPDRVIAARILARVAFNAKARS